MQKVHCFPTRHPGTTIPQTWLFSPSVTNQSHSELLYPAQVTRKRREEGECESPYQHTPARFPPPGKSTGWGFLHVLPKSRHATFLVPAAEKLYSRTPDLAPSTHTQHPCSPRTPQSVVVNQSLRVEKTIFMKGLDGRTTTHRVSEGTMIGKFLMTGWLGWI